MNKLTQLSTSQGAVELPKAKDFTQRLYVTTQIPSPEGRKCVVKSGEATLVEYTGFAEMDLMTIHDNAPEKKITCLDDMIIVISDSKIVFARIYCVLTADQAIESAKILTGMLRVWFEGNQSPVNVYVLSHRVGDNKIFYGFHKEGWDRRSEFMTEHFRGFAKEINATFFYQTYYNSFHCDAVKRCYVKVGPFGEEGDENRPHVMIDDIKGQRVVRDSL
jgi:hypothetical protein